MVNRERNYAIIGAAAFGSMSAALIVWNAYIPGDQIILLFLLATPVDIPSTLINGALRSRTISMPR